MLAINGADDGTAVAGNLFVDGELTVEGANGPVNVVSALAICTQDYTALLERVVQLESIVSGALRGGLPDST